MLDLNCIPERNIYKLAKYKEKYFILLVKNRWNKKYTEIWLLSNIKCSTWQQVYKESMDYKLQLGIKLSRYYGIKFEVFSNM